jgi:hypothetical protein
MASKLIRIQQSSKQMSVGRLSILESLKMDNIVVQESSFLQEAIYLLENGART